jgi:hypothetical protein
LIEFGRYAAERRKKKGLGKPETFNFLGFTHICGKTRKGFEWAYLFGAVCPARGIGAALVLPYVDAAAMNLLPSRRPPPEQATNPRACG